MALTAPSAVLTGSTIASSFDQLLFVDAAAGMTEATLKIVSTEVGKSALSISDEHVLIKGVDTNNAAGFEVQQTDGTSILKVAAGTPSVLVSGSGTKLYLSDAGGEYISGDGTDLTITSGNDIVLAVGTAGSVYSSGDGGTSNTIYGEDAGVALVGGANYNVLFGKDAGKAINAGDQNTVVGYLAGDAIAGGSYNVAVGANAGGGISSGDQNVAVGQGTMNGTLTTNLNTAVGDSSMNALTAGANNVAVGASALNAVADTESDNVAIGYLAMGAADQGSHANADVDQNVCIGTNAGLGGDFGSAELDFENNVAIGYAAMDGTGALGGMKNVFIGAEAGGGSWATALSQQNVGIGYRSMDAAMNSANNNVAVGMDSLGSLTTADQCTALGFNAGVSMTTGGSNTIVGSNAGITLSTTTLNTFVGKSAGEGIQGEKNVVVGADAASSATADIDNCTVVGYLAGASLGGSGTEADADGTTLVGYGAGTGLTDGSNNTAVGFMALATEDNADGNTAVGLNALRTQNGGADNIGIGVNAGYSITTGSYNTALGNGAMGEAAANAITANSNTCVGYHAGYEISGDGDTNTYIGAESGVNSENGDSNTCVGSNAGQTITSGSKNVLIGYQVDCASGQNFSMGFGREFTASSAENGFTVGNGSNTMFYDLDSGNITITSDRRVKDDIVDSPIGLTFVDKLKPVQFVKKAPSEWPSAFWNLSKLPEDSPERTSTEKGEKIQTGLIAQDVKAVMDELDIDFTGWSEQEETGRQELSYVSFVVPLIKAVQELSAKVKALEDAQ